MPPPSGGKFPTFVLNQRPNVLPSLEITGPSSLLLHSISYPQVTELDNSQNGDKPPCWFRRSKFSLRRSAPVPMSHIANRTLLSSPGPTPAQGAIAMFSDGSTARPVHFTDFVWWTIEFGTESSKSMDCWERGGISWLALKRRRSNTRHEPKDPFTTTKLSSLCSGWMLVVDPNEPVRRPRLVANSAFPGDRVSIIETHPLRCPNKTWFLSLFLRNWRHCGSECDQFRMLKYDPEERSKKLAPVLASPPWANAAIAGALFNWTGNKWHRSGWVNGADHIPSVNWKNCVLRCNVGLGMKQKSLTGDANGKASNSALPLFIMVPVFCKVKLCSSLSTSYVKHPTTEFPWTLPPNNLSGALYGAKRTPLIWTDFENLMEGSLGDYMQRQTAHIMQPLVIQKATTDLSSSHAEFPLRFVR